MPTSNILKTTSRKIFYGARRLQLSTVGFLYIAPSLTFALAVLVYAEPLTRTGLFTFTLIWAALGLVSWEAWRTRSQIRSSVSAQTIVASGDGTTLLFHSRGSRLQRFVGAWHLSGVQVFTSVEGEQAVSDFEDLYRTQRERVVQLAWLLTHDAAAAEDVAHDAFTALFRVYESVQNPAAYLRRSVINGVYERTRRRARESRRNQLVITGEALTTSGPTGGIADVVGRLHIDQRTAVVLRYWGGLLDQEIADAMGIRPSTARSHLSRARNQLRKELL